MTITSRIIVVDDDFATASLIKIMLEMDGYAVTVCGNVNHARDAAAGGVDAFVVDYYLEPGESGLELLRSVREGETAAAAATPILIASGDVRREEEVRAAGADHFLLKPYPPKDLSNLLKTILTEEKHRE